MKSAAFDVGLAKSNSTGASQPSAGAADLLRMLAPDGPWTVRTFSSLVDNGPPQLPKKLGYSIGPANADDHKNGLHGWIGAATAGRHNCYFHVNVGPPDKPKLAQDDVICSRAAHVDIDPDPKQFEESRAAILAAMQDEEPPFSCIVDSGNGYQGYKFIEPYRVDGESARIAELRRRNLAISQSLTARLAGTGAKIDSCHSIDHLMRLPDTINFLTPPKRDKGYPPGDRPARIVEWYPERIYKLDELPAAEPVRNYKSEGRGVEPPSEWTKLNTEALKNLDAWVPALFGDAAELKNGKYRISSQALGRDLQEDLSISPEGIKDFGVHDVGDAREGRRSPIDLVMEHGAKDFNKAVEWLCERLGQEPRVAVQKTTTRKSSTVVCAADIVIRPKDWIWKGHLLRGAQELLTGTPGLGKSQVQIGYIACVTAGLKWPDGTAGGAPASVLMLSAEDTLDQEVVPRLLAAGADCKRVHILKCIKTDERTSRQFLLGEDLDQLESIVRRIGDVGLVTIDPITAFMGGKMDSHKTTEVRSQLGPLKDFAERANVAVSTITHPPKVASQKAIDHFIGSQAFIAAGRIGHVCIEETKAVDDDEEGKKEITKTGRILFANAKNNPHVKMPTLAYTIKEVVVGQDPKTGEGIAAPHVVWADEPVDITADEAVAALAGGRNRGDTQRGAQGEVQDFLDKLLKDGPVGQSKIKAEAKRHGFSSKQLKTAKQKLYIVSSKMGFGGGWTWRLPF